MNISPSFSTVLILTNLIPLLTIASQNKKTSLLLPNLCLYFTFFLDKLRQLEASALNQVSKHIISFQNQSCYLLGQLKGWSNVTNELTIIVSIPMFLLPSTLLSLNKMISMMISLWSNDSVLNQDQGQLHLD